MRELALLKLNELNEKGIITTRLYYVEDGKEAYVEDYSYFANDKYMSEELLNSLATGGTLIDELQQEIDVFKIETVLN